MINVGSFIASTGVAYVQQEIGFGWGYLIPALALLMSVGVFISPRQYYIKSQPNGK